MHKKARLTFAAFALLLAVLYDVFFWDKAPGLGFALFTLIYVVGFLGIAVSGGHLRNKAALWLLVPIGIMSVDFVIYNNTLVKDGVPLFVLGLLALFSILSTVKNPEKHRFSLSKIPIIRNVFTLFDHLTEFQADLLNRRKSENPKTGKILLGVFISLPILILFMSLFMSADAVFAEWMSDLFDFDVEADSVWRIIRTALITIVLSTFFYALVSEKHQLGKKLLAAAKLDHTITTVVLTLINLLFLSFVFIQLNYLFGNEAFVADQGISFAEYARSGFFQLAWVMVFASFLIGVIYRSFAHNGHTKLITALQVLLAAQVGVIAASALTRMNLYQEAFGYTVLRLYVEWFIYLVLALLALGIFSLLTKQEFRKFFYSSAILSLTALTVVCSVNVDYMIAKQNITRYVEAYPTNQKTSLDNSYLSTLSVDVLPAYELLTSEAASNDILVRGTGVSPHLAAWREYLRQDRGLFEYNRGIAKGQAIIDDLIKKFE